MLDGVSLRLRDCLGMPDVVAVVSLIERCSAVASHPYALSYDNYTFFCCFDNAVVQI